MYMYNDLQHDIPSTLHDSEALYCNSRLLLWALNMILDLRSRTGRVLSLAFDKTNGIFKQQI